MSTVQMVAAAAYKLPKSILEAVKAACVEHTEIREAIEQANRVVRDLPEFDDFREILMDAAIQWLVYDARSRLNRGVRKHARTVSTRPNYDGVKEVYRSFYDQYEKTRLAARNAIIDRLMGQGITKAEEIFKFLKKHHPELVRVLIGKRRWVDPASMMDAHRRARRGPR